MVSPPVTPPTSRFEFYLFFAEITSRCSIVRQAEILKGRKLLLELKATFLLATWTSNIGNNTATTTTTRTSVPNRVKFQTHRHHQILRTGSAAAAAVAVAAAAAGWVEPRHTVSARLRAHRRWHCCSWLQILGLGAAHAPTWVPAV